MFQIDTTCLFRFLRLQINLALLPRVSFRFFRFYFDFSFLITIWTFYRVFQVDLLGFISIYSVSFRFTRFQVDLDLLPRVSNRFGPFTTCFISIFSVLFWFFLFNYDLDRLPRVSSRFTRFHFDLLGFISIYSISSRFTRFHFELLGFISIYSVSSRFGPFTTCFISIFPVLFWFFLFNYDLDLTRLLGLRRRWPSIPLCLFQ